MGCCQNKEIYVVCALDCAGEQVEKVGVGAEDEETVVPALVGKAASIPDAKQYDANSYAPQPEAQAEGEKVDARLSLSSAAPVEALKSAQSMQQVSSLLPEVSSLASAKTVEECKTEEPPPLPLVENLHLTGNFAKWVCDFAPGKLNQVPCPTEGFARLSICVKLTSQSFSFQVVSKENDWKWRLYPRDAKNIRFTHASKEGRLVPDNPTAVIVGLGNMKLGHGLNFHVIEQEGVVVTVYVEVPVQQKDGRLHLRTDTADGAHVWYTLKDTGVQYCGGDGVDLNQYKWMGLG